MGSHLILFRSASCIYIARSSIIIPRSLIRVVQFLRTSAPNWDQRRSMADAEVSAEKLQPAAPVAGEDEAEARTFPFPFFNCGGLQDERRLILKSKAKDAGLERANSILTLLDNAPEHANDPTLKKIRAMIRELRDSGKVRL